MSEGDPLSEPHRLFSASAIQSVDQPLTGNTNHSNLISCATMCNVLTLLQGI